MPPLSPGHLAMAGGVGTWPGVSPALYQLHRGCAQHPVRKQVDLFHDVGQAHRQLLPEEGEGGFLAGITGPWREGEGGERTEMQTIGATGQTSQGSG